MDLNTVLEALDCVRPVTAGSTFLIAALCEEIHLKEIIDETLEWDEKHWKLSPGTLVKALVTRYLHSF